MSRTGPQFSKGNALVFTSDSNGPTGVLKPRDKGSIAKLVKLSKGPVGRCNGGTHITIPAFDQYVKAFSRPVCGFLLAEVIKDDDGGIAKAEIKEALNL
jgi:hypothetical protein